MTCVSTRDSVVAGGETMKRISGIEKMRKESRLLSLSSSFLSSSNESNGGGGGGGDKSSKFHAMMVRPTSSCGTTTTTPNVTTAVSGGGGGGGVNSALQAPQQPPARPESGIRRQIMLNSKIPQRKPPPTFEFSSLSSCEGLFLSS